MKARELKEKILRKKYVDKFSVIGKLSSCARGTPDAYWCIHDDEKLTENVGISLSIRSECGKFPWED